jgi:hypothetical protein
MHTCHVYACHVHALHVHACHVHGPKADDKYKSHTCIIVVGGTDLFLKTVVTIVHMKLYTVRALQLVRKENTLIGSSVIGSTTFPLYNC